MNESIFLKSKNVFLDLVNAKDYVQLNRVATLYQSLKESLEKPLKMVLLYGKPGTGKSMLLNKLHTDSTLSMKTFLYLTPILDESEFYKTLAQDIFKTQYTGELNLTQFMKIVEKSKQSSIPVVLLDEAQLYSEDFMEKIRLLSDARVVKFLITLHKTEREDLIAKEHFKTRIWESIELKNASASELKIYIQKKLMKLNCFNTATMFTSKSVNKIFKITNGNYRDTNKLLYTLFDIYLAYENSNQLRKMKTDQVSIKIIEMAAIHTGLLNA